MDDPPRKVSFVETHGGGMNGLFLELRALVCGGGKEGRAGVLWASVEVEGLRGHWCELGGLDRV